MNMILCGENCRHQKDGYCCLEEWGRLNDARSSPCCYFEEKEKADDTDYTA